MTCRITQEQFEFLLEEAKSRIMADTRQTKGINSGEQFEELVFNTLQNVGQQNQCKFYRSGKLAFPDIYAGNYGVEVKFSGTGKWTSVGNSIMETTRVKAVSSIYTFFGRKDHDSITIKWRIYQDCLSNIVVTHHPRYLIDMDLIAGQTVFDKMDVPYEAFCGQDAIQKLKQHYRKTLKPNEELWWLGGETSPVIRELNGPDRRKVLVEGMVLCPEVFSSSSAKYLNFSIYLLESYNAVSSSLRDLFSSGGTVCTEIKGVNINLPRVFYNLYCNAKKVQDLLVTAEEEYLLNFWEHKFGVREIKGNQEQTWKNIIDEQSKDALEQGIIASDVYTEGLARKG